MKTQWKILLISASLLLPMDILWAAVKFDYKISGIQGEPAENIDKRLKSKLVLIKQNLDKDQLIDFYQHADNEIKLALAPYGYFRATVHSKLKAISNNRWVGRFIVQPGPVIPLRNLRVTISGEGQNDPAFKSALANFPLKRREAFTVKNYEDAKNTLVNLAAQRGYFDAHMIENKLIIDQHPYGADVILSFQTGKRYFFGQVTFKYAEEPKKRLKESFLRRYIPFKENEPYDNEKLSKFQSNLSSSLYFQSVTVSPQIEMVKAKHVPITVTLTARKSQQYSFGLGFGTDTGLRGLTDINVKPLNSYGHYLSFNGKASLKSAADDAAEAKVSYNIPGANPNTDLYKISAEAEHSNDVEVGFFNNIKINASYSTLVKSWEQTAGVTLLFDRSEPNNEPMNVTTFLIPNIRWMKLQTDDATAPTKGYRINLSLRGASKATLGSTDFFQVYLLAKWMHTFNDSFRIIARGELGHLLTQDTNEIPISLRFYAGGSQSVRGHHLNEIGKNISGHTLSVGSLEFQQRIYGNFYIAAFFDAGQVGSSYFDKYHSAAGGGLVWHSPVGAIALTIARDLDNPNHPNLIQFSMGPEI